MSTAAIVTMVVGMLVIWGGLLLSIANARRAPGDGLGTPDDPDPDGGSSAR